MGEQASAGTETRQQRRRQQQDDQGIIAHSWHRVGRVGQEESLGFLLFGVACFVLLVNCCFSVATTHTHTHMTHSGCSNTDDKTDVLSLFLG